MVELRALARVPGSTSLGLDVGTSGNGDDVLYLKRNFHTLMFRMIGCSSLLPKSQAPFRIWLSQQGTLSLLKWNGIFPGLGGLRLTRTRLPRENPESAGCGGMIRGDSGRWISGFKHNIGPCSAITTELWGVYIGLNLAWGKGFRKVILESDSQIFIQAINNPSGALCHHQLFRIIQSIARRQWEIEFAHTLR